MKYKLPLAFLFLFNFVVAQVPSDWSATSTYSSGALVISNGTTYIAQQDVNTAGTALTNTSYWLSLDSAAPSTTPSTSAPTTPPDTSTVPTTPPETDDSDDPDSSSISRFLGISTRGPISSDKKLYGGLTVLGTESKKVAFMAKGSSMTAQNITDYATDPLLVIKRKVYSEEQGKKVWETYRTVDDWVDVDSSESILQAEGQTGVILPSGDEEAGIVLDLEPGNYSFTVSSPTDSGIKQAIVEAYELSE